MDVPFCRKVLEFASAEHEDSDYRFDMNQWFRLTGDPVICETTACLAGTAVMLSPEAEVVSWTQDAYAGQHRVVTINGEVVGSPTDTFIQAGMALMGLTREEAHQLFMPMNYEQSIDSPTLNRQALDRLAEMIEEAEKAESESR